MRFGEMPCKNCSRFFCICSYHLTRSICSELLPPFGRFLCGKWHERCSLFPIVPCERQRCCSACSVWILQFERRVRRHHSRCPFSSAIRARVMFSCFRFLPCLGFEELHLLCMFHLGIAEYTSSMTHHIPWLLSIGQGTRTCHTDLYLIVCPLCCFQLLLPHVH